VTGIEQVPFGAAQFVENPEPRCPCLLLLDTSASMRGRPIEELNAGLVAFRDELAADEMAMKRIEIGLMTFGPVQLVADFTTPDLFYPPTLAANGDTPMGSAITQGLDLIRQRKEVYRAHGVAYYRPWVFLITDGGPTDAWQQAAREVREGEQSKSFMFFTVGVDGAAFDTLKQIGTREPLKLNGLRFRDLFVWLSNSLGAISRSQTSDVVPLENPVTPTGWASTA
jgi:uncharacterized protein YegL